MEFPWFLDDIIKNDIEVIALGITNHPESPPGRKPLNLSGALRHETPCYARLVLVSDETDDDKLYEGDNLWRLGGYPVHLWIIGVTGFLGLTVLLIFLMLQIANEPLEFKLPASVSNPPAGASAQ